MAQIEKRVGKHGRVTWRVRVTVKGCPPTSETFTRKTDASEWANETERALRSGRHFPDREMRHRTVAALIARYRLEVLPLYSRREQAQRSGKLGWWETHLGHILVSSLTTAQIVECRSRLARGEGLGSQPVGPATQVRYLAVLKHVLAKANREWEWMADNPALRVRNPREPRGRVRYLLPDEHKDLVSACQNSSDHRLYPLVVVALGTGARQGELLKLKWGDVDFALAQAAVDGKNGERRAVALKGSAAEVLRELHKARRLGTHLVFASRRGVAAFPRQAWEAALREAKIENFHFHDLRHTFASYLAMSGATLPELAAALGHKTLAMVQRYAHLAPTHTAGVVQRMTEKFLS